MTDDASLQSLLGVSRRELLDLSPRNRLLNSSRNSRSGSLEFLGADADELCQLLVVDKKTVGFAAIPEEIEDGTLNREAQCQDSFVPRLLFPAEDVEPPVREPDLRSGKLRLQTRLTSEKLQRKLLKPSYDARTFEEEQCVKILYSALGFLKWLEDKSSDCARYAPPLLIPVMLDRCRAMQGRSGANNRRLREQEIRSRRTLDGKPVSPTIELLLQKAGLLAEASELGHVD